MVYPQRQYDNVRMGDDAMMATAFIPAAARVIDRRVTDRAVPDRGGAPEMRAGRVPRYGGVGEPPLEDLIADPMTRRLMASDRVGEGDLRAVIATARQALVGRPT